MLIIYLQSVGRGDSGLQVLSINVKFCVEFLALLQPCCIVLGLVSLPASEPICKTGLEFVPCQVSFQQSLSKSMSSGKDV